MSKQFTDQIFMQTRNTKEMITLAQETEWAETITTLQVLVTKVLQEVKEQASKLPVYQVQA